MQKPPVAVVLVLESTETGQGDQILRGAAEAVVDQLTSRDMVGVTDGAMGMVVPLAPLTDKAAIKHVILFGDGDTMDRNYQPAITAMHGRGITLSTVAIAAT